MFEDMKRSTFKTITWRIIATLTTMFLVYLFTGEMLLMMGVGLFEFLIKMVLYFIHERVWNLISFGKEL